MTFILLHSEDETRRTPLHAFVLDQPNEVQITNYGLEINLTNNHVQSNEALITNQPIYILTLKLKTRIR